MSLEKHKLISDNNHVAAPPPAYRSEFAAQGEKLSKHGFTDADLADFFGVDGLILQRWQKEYPEFREGLKRGRAEAKKRVEQSLLQCATGYSYDEEKIVIVKGKVMKVLCRKHVPPDGTAAIYWLQNRNPADWGHRVDAKDATPPDPEAEAKRNEAFKTMMSIVEERARNGQSPIFAKPKPK
jgi:hypothetical protein